MRRHTRLRRNISAHDGAAGRRPKTAWLMSFRRRRSAVPGIKHSAYGVAVRRTHTAYIGSVRRGTRRAASKGDAVSTNSITAAYRRQTRHVAASMALMQLAHVCMWRKAHHGWRGGISIRRHCGMAIFLSTASASKLEENVIGLDTRGAGAQSIATRLQYLVRIIILRKCKAVRRLRTRRHLCWRTAPRHHPLAMFTRGLHDIKLRHAHALYSSGYTVAHFRVAASRPPARYTSISLTGIFAKTLCLLHGMFAA